MQCGHLARRLLSTSAVWAARGNSIPNKFKTVGNLQKRLTARLVDDEEKRAKMGKKNRDRDLDPLAKLKERPDGIFRYCREVRTSIGRAIADTANLRTAFAGQGLTITKVLPTHDFRALMVFWSTTMPERTDTLNAALAEHADELRATITESRPQLGRLPELTFEKDLYYTTRLPLEDEFARLRELELRQEISRDELAIEEAKRLEELCTLQPPTDTLNFDREAAFKQISAAVEKGKASHRLAHNPDPAAVHAFKDYMKSNYESNTDVTRKKNIKKFIATKKRQMLLNEKQLQKERQS